MSLEVYWRGPIYYIGGYPAVGRRYVLGLDSMGVNVRIHHDFSTFLGDSVARFEPPNLGKRLWELSKNESVDRDKALLVHHCVASSFSTANRVKAGYTVFEADVLPHFWTPKCNVQDEVWTASEFCKKSFEKSGVNVPIYVIEHGVDCKRYNPDAAPLHIRNKAGFNFLMSTVWSGEQLRRNYTGVIEAYFRAFKHNEDVALIVHSFCSPEGSVNKREDVYGLIARIKRKLGLKKVPKLIWIPRFLTWYELPGLYVTCQAFVTATCGEGWGLPIGEAMACGLPTIATYWGGQTTYMNEKNSFPLEIEGLQPTVYWQRGVYDGTYMKWSKPSLDHLIELMRYVFDHRKEAKEVGLRAAEDMAENWPWERAVQKMYARIEVLHSRL